MELYRSAMAANNVGQELFLLPMVAKGVFTTIVAILTMTADTRVASMQKIVLYRLAALIWAYGNVQSCRVTFYDTNIATPRDVIFNAKKPNGGIRL